MNFPFLNLVLKGCDRSQWSHSRHVLVPEEKQQYTPTVPKSPQYET